MKVVIQFRSFANFILRFHCSQVMYWKSECLRAIALRLLYSSSIYMPGDYIVRQGDIGNLHNISDMYAVLSACAVSTRRVVVALYADATVEIQTDQ